MHYPKEYESCEEEEKDEYDFGILVLKEELERTNGYLGIDSMNEIEPLEKIEVYGYPSDKEPFSMYSAVEPLTSSTETFLNYQTSAFFGQNGGSPIIKEKEGKKLIIGIHLRESMTGKKALRINFYNMNLIKKWTK